MQLSKTSFLRISLNRIESDWKSGIVKKLSVKTSKSFIMLGTIGFLGKFFCQRSVFWSCNKILQSGWRIKIKSNFHILIKLPYDHSTSIKKSSNGDVARTWYRYHAWSHACDHICISDHVTFFLKLGAQFPFRLPHFLDDPSEVSTVSWSEFRRDFCLLSLVVKCWISESV